MSPPRAFAIASLALAGCACPGAGKPSAEQNPPAIGRLEVAAQRVVPLSGRGEYGSTVYRIEFPPALGFVATWLELRDSGSVEGNGGGDTGFDLDAVLVSPVLCEDVDCVERTASASSHVGWELLVRPGAMRGISDLRLHGTDWSGTRIDEEEASLFEFDGDDYLSMGERGRVAIQATAGFPKGSYVYVAEVGGHGGIEPATAFFANAPAPPPLPPASLDTAGPCTDAARGFDEASLRERMMSQLDTGLFCLQSFADLSGDRELVDKLRAVVPEQVKLRCYEDALDLSCAWGGPAGTIYVNMAWFPDCNEKSTLFHELMHVAGVPIDRGFHGRGDPVDRVYGCEYACFAITNDLDLIRNGCMACNGNQAAMKPACDVMACQELGCEECIECDGKLRCGKKCDVCYACPCDPEGHRPPSGDFVFYGSYDECMPNCIARTLSCFATSTVCEAMPCQ